MERYTTDEQDEDLGSPSFSSSSSRSSSSSSDFMEDADSSPSPYSSTDININPLPRMSDLLEELPIKKGLSKHFQGKSQSFRSLANVRCLEDFAKRIRMMPSYRKKTKPFNHSRAGRRDQTIKSISSKGRSSRIISKNHSSMGKSNHRHRNNGVLGTRPSGQPLIA